MSGRYLEATNHIEETHRMKKDLLLALLLMMGTCFGQSTNAKPPNTSTAAGPTSIAPSRTYCIDPETLKEAPCWKEPKVVPAIPVDYVANKKGDPIPNNHGWLIYFESDVIAKRPGCADKTRVLLTTEEGKKICVRF